MVSDLGISLPNRATMFGLSAATLIEVPVVAEESKLVDSIWVGDNFISQPRIESMVLLSAIAARTERVRLGTLCLATFPMRQPLQFAIQWASLDMLSGGRTVLGVCNGHSAIEGPIFANELRAMGVSSKDRPARVEEGIEVLRKAWSAGPIDHEGRFHRFEGVECFPKPAQSRVPILLAANPAPGDDGPSEERILRRVARLADGWQTGPRSVDVFRSHWGRIREYAEEYGRGDEVSRSVVHFRVNIDEDPDRARRDATGFTARYYADTISSEVLEMSDRSLVCGPAEALVERVAAFVEAGCTNPVFGFMSLDQPRQLERFLTDVAPEIRRVLDAVPGAEPGPSPGRA